MCKESFSKTERQILGMFLEDLLDNFGHAVCDEYYLENTPELRSLIIETMKRKRAFDSKDIDYYSKDMENSNEKECIFSGKEMLGYLMVRLREVGILPKKGGLK